MSTFAVAEKSDMQDPVFVSALTTDFRAEQRDLTCSALSISTGRD